MSQSYGEGASASGADSSESSGVVQTAKAEATQLTGTAAEQATAVVETAKAEAGAVAHEAKDQVTHLYHQTTQELRDQAAVQQRRVADGLSSIGGELSTMADRSDGGIGADLVRQVSTRVQGVAGWIGDRDPGSLLTEVKSYARRKPGTFIAIAAAAGLVAGRLARALSEGAGDSRPSGTASAGTQGASGAQGSGLQGASGAQGSGLPSTSGAQDVGFASPGATEAPVATAGATAPPVPPGVPTGIPDSAGGARHDDADATSLESDDTPLFDRTATHGAPEGERP